MQFSRTNSLYYRVCYVVGVHNLKNFDFHKRVMSKMHVSEMNSVLKGFLTKRNAEAARKKTRDSTIEAKRRQKHDFHAKVCDQIFWENTADPKVGTYQSGIGAACDEGGAKKVAKQNIQRKRVLCDCGGLVGHYNSNSKHCRRVERK